MSVAGLASGSGEREMGRLEPQDWDGVGEREVPRIRPKFLAWITFTRIGEGTW